MARPLRPSILVATFYFLVAGPLQKNFICGFHNENENKIIKKPLDPFLFTHQDKKRSISFTPFNLTYDGGLLLHLTTEGVGGVDSNSPIFICENNRKSTFLRFFFNGKIWPNFVI